MSIRLATITAVSFLVASPALADCKQDLAMLEQPAVSAETGASTGKSGMPVTEHQEAGYSWEPDHQRRNHRIDFQQGGSHLASSGAGNRRGRWYLTRSRR